MAALSGGIEQIARKDDKELYPQRATCKVAFVTAVEMEHHNEKGEHQPHNIN